MGTNKDLFKQAQAFLIQVIQRYLIESKRMPGQEVSTGKLRTGMLRTPFPHVSGQSDL